MIIKSLENGAKTDEEYRSLLISRRRLKGFLVLVGVITVIVSVLWMKGAKDDQIAFMSGVFTGTGTVMILFGLRGIWKIGKMLKDEKKLRQESLKESDERSHLIVQKAMHMAGLISMCVCYAGLLASGFINMTLFWTLWGVVMLYSVLSVVLRKYYERRM